jgi:hypothetical protein|tara:strand:- start:120 stop:377 length:258 start_codon:yes stop_codon:yes gene_type:complete
LRQDNLNKFKITEGPKNSPLYIRAFKQKKEGIVPKEKYRQQIKELTELKKDGKQIAKLGGRMIDKKISNLQNKLKGYKPRKKFRR